MGRLYRQVSSLQAPTNLVIVYPVHTGALRVKHLRLSICVTIVTCVVVLCLSIVYLLFPCLLAISLFSSSSGNIIWSHARPV